jgi:transcriptional antiterminator NusG
MTDATASTDPAAAPDPNAAATSTPTPPSQAPGKAPAPPAAEAAQQAEREAAVEEIATRAADTSSSRSKTRSRSTTGAKSRRTKPADPAPTDASATTATDTTAVTATADTDAATEQSLPATPSAPDPGSNKKWYVIKVQSGREESIKMALERKIKIEGLEPYVGQIIIPYEEVVLKKTVKVKDKKTGEMVPQEKKVIKKQKKYPGYLFAELEINERILYLFRSTNGVGDFVGARARQEPPPMTDREVQQLLSGVTLPGDRRKTLPRQIVKLDFERGDKVRIREGAFAGMEGEVKSISEARDEGDTPKVTVVVTVFGRPVDVTVEYWQVDKA